MKERTKEWILFISSSFPLMMSCLSVQGRLWTLSQHYCSCKTSANSPLVSQGALWPLWQTEGKSSDAKGSLIWAPACCLSTGRRWQEVLKSPESHALRYLAPPPLRDLDVGAVSRSRNDPGWRGGDDCSGISGREDGLLSVLDCRRLELPELPELPVPMSVNDRCKMSERPVAESSHGPPNAPAKHTVACDSRNDKMLTVLKRIW